MCTILNRNSYDDPVAFIIIIIIIINTFIYV